MLQFSQKQPIGTNLCGPFTLTKVPVRQDRSCIRKKFRCAYEAVGALQKLKLRAEEWHGADVTDAVGIVIAELE